MYPELAEIAGKIVSNDYIIDSVPNLYGPEIRKLCVPFILTLYKANPGARFTIVGSRENSAAWKNSAMRLDFIDREAAISQCYMAVKAAGIDTTFISGDKLTSPDDTVDGVHPNDVGHLRQGEVIGGVGTPSR